MECRSRIVLSALRAAPATLALVLAAAVFANAADGGRPYFYCHAMQSVMSRACCGSGAQRAEAHDTVVAAPCCEGRSNAALEAFPVAPRVDEPAAPVVTLPAANATPALLALQASSRAIDIAPPLRARPPNIRVHALLMVFHV